MENEELFNQLEDAFEDVSVLSVPLGEEQIKITSMSEIPLEQMLQFLVADNNEKLVQMFGLVKLCLINPDDFHKFEQLNTKRFLKFVDAWTQKSSDDAMGEPIEYDD